MHATCDPRDKGGGLDLVDCRMPANGAGASTSVLCPTLTDSVDRQALPCQNLNETSHATIVQTGAVAKVASWRERLSKPCTTTGQEAWNHLQDLSLSDKENEPSHLEVMSQECGLMRPDARRDGDLYRCCGTFPARPGLDCYKPAPNSPSRY
jgi:hypothetical protein